jgi:hypothetical protein
LTDIKDKLSDWSLISISKETKSQLAALRAKNERFDDLIRKLIDKWKEKPSIDRYSCRDDRPKNRRLIFDGGQMGQYSVDLCDICYRKQDKKFLSKEMKLLNDVIRLPQRASRFDG